MRLVCPNCDAEYEVDDAAIPRAGRDVQCSNCGHAWFQLHPDVIAEEEEENALYGTGEPVAPEEAFAEPEETLDAVAASAEPVAEPAPEVPPAVVIEPPPAAAFEPPPAPPPPPAAARSVDASILAVLREEAEREVAARRSEMPALETQTEMPLEPAAAIASAAAAAADASRPRRDLLPAIEEINSSLRASSDRGGDAEDAVLPEEAAAAKSGGGFRQGFLTLVLLGVIVLALYVFAPLIAAKVPALAGAAAAYVAAVDTARLWLDTEIRALIGWLQGFAGGAKG